MDTADPPARPAGLRSRVPRAKTQIPVLSPHHQHRRRLLDALDAGRADQVTLLSAPAGFGKTQLLVEWVTARPEPVAWLTLDGDEDDGRFWAGVLAAIGTCAPPGSAVHRLEVPAAPSGDADLHAALAAAVDALPEPILLVLDDVHQLTSAAALHGLAALVRDRSPGMRLVLSGRIDPPLPVARLRMDGELCEVRAAALRFRLSEAEAKLAAEEVDLLPAQVRLLVAQTEGWAAGLRLAAISLGETDDPDRFLADLAGNGRAVSDYLVGEVLSGLAPDVLDVLRAVSTCDRVSAELAAELSGRPEAGEVLDALERRTALVLSGGAGRTWYRIEPLLRAHLRADLQRSRPDLAVTLHDRAATWFAARRQPERALDHARLGGDPDRLVALLRRTAITLLSDGRASTVRAAVAWLTDRGVELDAWTALVDALAALETAETAQADALLAETPDDGPEAEPGLAELRGLVRSRRAGLAVDGVEMERAARAAVAPASDRTGDDDERWDLAAMARLEAAFTAATAGADPAEAIGPARAVLEGARRRHHGYLAARALATLAAAAGAVGDNRRMAQLAEQAENELPGPDWATTIAAGLASTLRGYAALVAAEPARALEHLAPVPPAAPGAPDHGVEPPIRAAARGAALADLGRTAEGLDELAAARTAAEGLHNPVRLVAAMTALEHAAATAAGRVAQARAVLVRAEEVLGPASADVRFLHVRRYVALGRWDAAAEVLAPVLDGSAALLVTWTPVEARVVACQLALRAGRRPQARRELGRALELAGAGDVLRPLVLAPAEVLDLLTRHLGGFGAHEAVAARVLRARNAWGSAADPVHLTERERDVLSLLPTQRSLEEIAVELTVSHSTVKTHVKSIYTKLDARSRREAVTTARRNGLITPAPP